MTVKTVSTKEMAKKVLNQDPLFILDVRSTGAFDEWKVEGKNTKVVNAPFSQLTEEDAILDKLPKDKEIYTMCAKGNSSKKAAEYLEEKGFKNVILLKAE